MPTFTPRGDRSVLAYGHDTRLRSRASRGDSLPRHTDQLERTLNLTLPCPILANGLFKTTPILPKRHLLPQARSTNSPSSAMAQGLLLFYSLYLAGRPSRRAPVPTKSSGPHPPLSPHPWPEGHVAKSKDGLRHRLRATGLPGHGGRPAAGRPAVCGESHQRTPSAKWGRQRPKNMRFSRGKRPLTPIVSVGGVGWRIEKLHNVRPPLALRQLQALAEQPSCWSG